jgi:hypothetical protein
MTWGRTWWPLFLIISAIWLLLAFGIPELIAIFTKGPGAHLDNTLSNYSRSELHVTATLTRHTIAWYLSFLTWSVFAGIITLHIWFDWNGN